MAPTIAPSKAKGEMPKNVASATDGEETIGRARRQAPPTVLLEGGGEVGTAGPRIPGEDEGRRHEETQRQRQTSARGRVR